ncbi:MAG: CheY-like chemotaxis protein [Planctomycetota bacterium]
MLLSMRVLIVENEIVVARAMASALESRGHQVVVAKTVELALSLSTPEVLIADAELPGLSGLDLLERYRREGHAPRTVFISNEPSLESCRRALRLGAAEFLSKPFRLEELVNAVELDKNSQTAFFEESYQTTDANIGIALRDVAAFALRQGISPTCRARVCTALGEIIENVMDHAYPASLSTYEVRAVLDGRDLVVTVNDQGIGFDTSKVTVDYMSTSGGLARAASLAESVELASEPGRLTAVTMRFGAYLIDYNGADQVDLSEMDFFTPDTSREILNTLACDGGESFFQLSPALAVVIGRMLAGPDTKRLAAQALRS